MLEVRSCGKELKLFAGSPAATLILVSLVVVFTPSENPRGDSTAGIPAVSKGPIIRNHMKFGAGAQVGE